MNQADPETEQLLTRAAQGDQTALEQLFGLHRQRLRQMIALRLDRQVQARLDPSDVVQETLAEAARRLADYARVRPLPFYPWLRQLAWERLMQLHRRHVRAGKRTVRREQADLPLSEESALALADRLVSRGSSPSARLRRSEQRHRVQAILGQLADADREVLVLRYLEHLSTQEMGVHFYAMQYIDGHSLATGIAELRGRADSVLTQPEPAPAPQPGATVDPPPDQLIEPISPSSPARETTALAGLSTMRSTKDAGYFRRVAQLGIQAAEALDHAHQMGVIHRDIKPANLLVDATGRLWVTDFGLAQVQSDTRLTLTGDLVGTLRYMSPEQAMAQRVPVDHRTDIYSLGVTLYELLTLEPAFDGKDRQELLRQIAFEEPKPARRINRTVPPELETIVAKAMEKNPGDRYTTAQELADDLERYLKDEPIRAKRPTMAQRLRKWTRRHTAVVRATAAVAFVVVVAAIVVLWRERDRAEAEKIQTEEKYQAVDAQRQRALGHLRVAVDALQAIYLKEGERRLLYDEGPPEVPEHLLKLGLNYYERLVQDSGGEPKAQVEKAKAQLQIGNFRYWLGQHIKAEAANREGIQIAEALAAKFPSDRAYREVLASGYNNLGTLLMRLQRYQDAEIAYRRALLLKRELAQEVPDQPAMRQQLANGLGNLASVLLRLERLPEASNAGREALDLAEHLVADFSDNVFYQATLGAILDTLAWSHWKKGDRTQAIKLFRRAVEHGRAGTKGPSAHIVHLQFLGNHYAGLGECLLAVGDRTEAEKAWREAVAVRRRLADGYPAIGELRFASSDISWHLGKFLLDAGRFPDAADVLLQAINREEARADQIRDKPLHLRLLASLHYLRGATLRMARRPQEAEPHYLRAIALHQDLVRKFPKSVEYRRELAKGQHNLAIVYWQLQQYEKAIAYYSKVIDLEPASALAWNNRGIAYANLQQHARALHDFSKAIELDSMLAAPWSNRGGVYVALHQYEKAVFDASKAIELDPKNAPYWNTRGMAHTGLRQHDNAVADLSTAIKLNPKNPAPWSNRGNAYHALQQKEKAVGDFTMAVNLDPRHYEAWMGLGEVFSALRQYDKAIAAYKKAALLKPDLPNPRWGLGNVGGTLANQGHHDEAIAAFKELIALKPDDAGARNNLGMSLEAKGLIDQAIAAYREAIRREAQKSPQQQVRDHATGTLLIAIVHNNLGNALATKGLLDLAIVAYRDAIRHQQDYAMAHSNLGGTLIDKGLFEEGMAEHKKAIRLQPKDAIFHYDFGIALERHGLLDKAVAEYKEAIRLRPGSAGFHCRLAIVLRRQGRFVQSLAAYKHGHELGSRQSNWDQPSAEWVREAERLVTLDARLSKIRRGPTQPASAQECIELARFCQVHKKCWPEAVRFYGEAFAGEPKLAEDLTTQDRYNAACAAVQAGCLKGKDAAMPDAKDRAQMRQQALDWLRADLAFYARLADITPEEVHAFVQKRMQHWLKDANLAGVRGEALAQLPQAERQAWQQLWTTVEETLRKATHKDGKDTQKKP